MSARVREVEALPRVIIACERHEHHQRVEIRATGRGYVSYLIVIV